ncbi:uncharacterized protein LOC111270562 [Varroa jacobsoni]|uniref:uncharacterized protein LOC111270562 n=1 Tax=Varroa jacobsoni TaxID=62625 RepID=UPI000BF45614|nr:uncharacterized protein LOC111270562 [Varroa jacobsoni]
MIATGASIMTADTVARTIGIIVVEVPDTTGLIAARIMVGPTEKGIDTMADTKRDVMGIIMVYIVTMSTMVVTEDTVVMTDMEEATIKSIQFYIPRGLLKKSGPPLWRSLWRVPSRKSCAS